MKYLVSSLIFLCLFLVIVMGVYDRRYASNINDLEAKITNLEEEVKTNREEKVKVFLEDYLDMEITDLQEQFKNKNYASYTYRVNGEIQTAVLDNNLNLVALNPDNIKQYEK